MLIVCCHTCEWIGYTLGESNALGIFGNWCAVGVQIFFILSGYLYGMRAELFQKEKRIHFLLRNFNKIALDYFVYMLIVVFPVYLHGKSMAQFLSEAFKLLTFSGIQGGYTTYGSSLIFCYAISLHHFCMT